MQVRDPFLEYLGLDVAVVRGRPVLVRHEPVDSRAGKRPVAVRRRRVRGKTHYEVIHPQRARRGGAGRLHRTVPRPEFVASLGAFPSVAKRIAALAARAAALRKRAGRAEATIYVVKSNDLLSTIAEKTGVSVDTILQLNPGLDPQALVPGQKIKLR